MGLEDTMDITMAAITILIIIIITMPLWIIITWTKLCQSSFLPMMKWTFHPLNNINLKKLMKFLAFFYQEKKN